MAEDIPTSRERLTALRLPLLDLHRALIEDERRLYELAHGRVTPGELLNLALKHPQFAWLHILSSLIVRIDELLAAEEPPGEPEVAAIVSEVRSRLMPSPTGTFVEQRYDRAIQNNRAVLLAHSAVMQLLR